MAPTLRPRNGATKRLSISSDFKVKKTITKKKRKKIVIPRDFLIDSIFPFLSNHQLYPLRFVQRSWKRLIETGMAKRQFHGRTVLHRITFADNNYFDYGVDLGKTHPILKEGEKATLRIWSRSYFYVYIDPQSGGDNSRTLMLKLPKNPATSGQLRFVRYWLRQLSQAHFEIGEYRADVLNPEFIGMVFLSDATHEENFCLSFDTLKMPTDFTKREMHKSLLQIARVNRLEFKAYVSTKEKDINLENRLHVRDAKIHKILSDFFETWTWSL